jgi:hypothetical protein
MVILIMAGSVIQSDFDALVAITVSGDRTNQPFYNLFST